MYYDFPCPLTDAAALPFASEAYLYHIAFLHLVPSLASKRATNLVRSFEVIELDRGQPWARRIHLLKEDAPSVIFRLSLCTLIIPCALEIIFIFVGFCYAHDEKIVRNIRTKCQGKSYNESKYF